MNLYRIPEDVGMYVDIMACLTRMMIVSYPVWVINVCAHLQLTTSMYTNIYI